MSKDYRVQWVYDDSPDLSYLEQWDTLDKYKGNEIIVDGKKVPFTCYIQTYGNPDNYECLACVLEERCDCCGQWNTVGSLWGIDFYKPDTSLDIPTPGDSYELDVSGLWDGTYGVLSGYPKDVADDLLIERRLELEQTHTPHG